MFKTNLFAKKKFDRALNLMARIFTIIFAFYWASK